VVLGVVLVFAAKLSLNWLTPFEVEDELSGRDNPAFGVSLVGYLLGVLIIYAGVLMGESLVERPLWQDLLLATAWTLGGVVALHVARIVLDRVVFHKFSAREEIVGDRNVGMGAVELGTTVGSAMVVAGAVSGTGGGIHTAFAFFVLGQLVLVAFAFVYQRTTRYDLHAELEGDNVAAGVAYAGNLVAMGLFMMRGTAGDFYAWGENLGTFGYYAVGGFVLMLLGRHVIDWVLLPGRTLHEEIAEDRNVGAGWLEGGMLVGLAVVACLAI